MAAGSTRSVPDRRSPRLPPASPAATDVLTQIVMHGPIARVEIARRTGLSQAAVTKAVTPLIDAGFVAFDRARRDDGTSAGRPVTPLRAVPESAIAIGIKVTGAEVIGVTTDLGARIRDRARRSLARHTPGQVCRTVESVVRTLRGRLDLPDERVIGVGVSVSGDIDTHGGIVRHSPLLGWRDAPLRDLLRDRTGLPVRIDNDVRALTIAERWFGAGAGVDSFVVVTIGSGIGCGLYLNGDVVTGAFGVAGEIGHLPLGTEGLVCTCGRTDCVETVASSDAILSAVRRATGRDDIDMHGAVLLARSGDRDAIGAFDRAAQVIGSALAVVVNLAGPQVAVIEGEAVTDFDLYESQIRRAFGTHAFGAAGACELRIRPHTFDAWARGAAVSLIRTFIQNGSVDAG